MEKIQPLPPDSPHNSSWWTAVNDYYRKLLAYTEAHRWDEFKEFGDEDIRDWTYDELCRYGRPLVFPKGTAQNVEVRMALEKPNHPSEWTSEDIFHAIKNELGIDRFLGFPFLITTNRQMPGIVSQAILYQWNPVEVALDDLNNALPPQKHTIELAQAIDLRLNGLFNSTQALSPTATAIELRDTAETAAHKLRQTVDYWYGITREPTILAISGVTDTTAHLLSWLASEQVLGQHIVGLAPSLGHNQAPILMVVAGPTFDLPLSRYNPIALESA